MDRDTAENQRSLEMTMAQPGKASRVSSSAQSLHVQVVGGLAEQQHVAAALQQLCQVHANSRTAAELADVLLLVFALEMEAAHVGPQGHLVCYSSLRSPSASG